MREDEAVLEPPRPPGYVGRRRRRLRRPDHPADVVLTVAALIYAVLLWVDPRAVLELDHLTGVERGVVLFPALLSGTALVVLQTVTLYGRTRRFRSPILALTTAWWVYTGVDSLLTDWHRPAWIPEFVLAWLACYCTLAVARTEVRQPTLAHRGR